jgi:hypothetical protein
MKEIVQIDWVYDWFVGVVVSDDWLFLTNSSIPINGSFSSAAVE